MELQQLSEGTEVEASKGKGGLLTLMTRIVGSSTISNNCG
ncbi:class III lanthipeptide [Bacillus amyloliquefaciens]|nr:class III lanthipeptide [Bacillus amyloliquefaciens]MBW8280954.1 class III lanthipeptide [Bacillus amyloliquefaciens]